MTTPNQNQAEQLGRLLRECLDATPVKQGSDAAMKFYKEAAQLFAQCLGVGELREALRRISDLNDTPLDEAFGPESHADQWANKAGLIGAIAEAALKKCEVTE